MSRTVSAPAFSRVTTAAAFLAFARTPAAATILEVGLGGRLDATNVVTPVVAGIAQLGIDHQAFLGDRLIDIAGEKAGIAKPGVPLVTMNYPKPVGARIAAVAAAAGAPVIARNRDWTSETAKSTVRYQDAGFSLVTRRPRLVGAHQSRNLALAIAMLRHQGALAIPEAAMRAAADWATWPARMQRLGTGPLSAMLPQGSDLWLDGAHNPSAAAPVARALRTLARGRPVVLVTGMLANKDAEAILATLAPSVNQVIAIPVPGHAHHAPGQLADLARALDLAATTAPGIEAAVSGAGSLAGGAALVLIAGSLYIAGEALTLNDELPD